MRIFADYLNRRDTDVLAGFWEEISRRAEKESCVLILNRCDLCWISPGGAIPKPRASAKTNIPI